LVGVLKERIYLGRGSPSALKKMLKRSEEEANIGRCSEGEDLLGEVVAFSPEAVLVGDECDGVGLAIVGGERVGADHVGLSLLSFCSLLQDFNAVVQLEVCLVDGSDGGHGVVADDGDDRTVLGPSEGHGQTGEGSDDRGDLHGVK